MPCTAVNGLGSEFKEPSELQGIIPYYMFQMRFVNLSNLIMLSKGDEDFLSERDVPYEMDYWGLENQLAFDHCQSLNSSLAVDVPPVVIGSGSVLENSNQLQGILRFKSFILT